MSKYKYSFDCWQMNGREVLVLAQERRTLIQKVFCVEMDTGVVSDRTGVHGWSANGLMRCEFTRLKGRSRAEIRYRMANVVEARLGAEMDGQLLVKWIPR